MKICRFLCIVTHAFWDIPEIMCHQPPALGARYVMNTPTLGYYPTHNAHLWGVALHVSRWASHFLKRSPSFVHPFSIIPEGYIMKKKKVGKQISWSLNPKPRTGAFTEI
jgi:hypothetical protein